MGWHNQQHSTNIRGYAAVSLVPSLEEQQQNYGKRWSGRLSVADEIEKELDGALVRAERLRGSVLKSAFEGGWHDSSGPHALAPSPINGRGGYVARRLSVADEIEKELDGRWSVRRGCGGRRSRRHCVRDDEVRGQSRKQSDAGLREVGVKALFYDMFG